MGRYNNTQVSPELRQAQDRGFVRPNALRVVLMRPRIPQNTGSIARMCAATGSHLDLIDPFFKIDDAKLKRAGLDYWPHLNVKTYAHFEEWQAAHPETRFWLVEVGGKTLYSEAQYQPRDALFFGDEQEGIPAPLLEKYPERHLHLPQINVRSLNLATTAGIVTFEAYKQLQFPFAQE